MLKELFESCFYITFHKRECVVNLTETTHNGNFALLDPEACRDCKCVCAPLPKNRKQLLVQASERVNTIKVDDVFAPVLEDMGEMCDYILDNSRKFVLVEMTCATKEYVGSKRVKCVGQLYNTLTNLRMCDPVGKHIEQKAEREVVFSWKETHEPVDLEDTIEKSMTAMSDMGDEVYSPNNVSPFESGFLYREIRYPDALVW